MLCQTYASDVIPHRRLEEMAGTSHLIPSALYNADLLGENGFECVDRIDGLHDLAQRYPQTRRALVRQWRERDLGRPPPERMPPR